MKALRYNNNVLEQLDTDWEFKPIDNIVASEFRTSKELLTLLSITKEVYLWCSCDDEFINMHKDKWLIYFGPHTELNINK